MVLFHPGLASYSGSVQRCACNPIRALWMVIECSQKVSGREKLFMEPPFQKLNPLRTTTDFFDLLGSSLP